MVAHLGLLPGKHFGVFQPVVVDPLHGQTLGGEGCRRSRLLSSSQELEGKCSAVLFRDGDSKGKGCRISDGLADLQVVGLVVLGQGGVGLMPLDPIATDFHLEHVLAGWVGHYLGVLLGNPHGDVSFDSILVADQEVGAAADGVHVDAAGGEVEVQRKLLGRLYLFLALGPRVFMGGGEDTVNITNCCLLTLVTHSLDPFLFELQSAYMCMH